MSSANRTLHYLMGILILVLLALNIKYESMYVPDSNRRSEPLPATESDHRQPVNAMVRSQALLPDSDRRLESDQRPEHLPATESDHRQPVNATVRSKALFSDSDRRPETLPATESDHRQPVNATVRSKASLSDSDRRLETLPAMESDHRQPVNATVRSQALLPDSDRRPESDQRPEHLPATESDHRQPVNATVRSKASLSDSDRRPETLPATESDHRQPVNATVRSKASLSDSDRRPETLPATESDHWQPVNSTSEVFVYSAYIEESKTSFVRIVGAIVRTSTIAENLYCIVRYGSMETRKTKAKVNIIPDGHDRRFHASLFTCNITMSSDDPPTSVSLVVGPQENTALNALPVHHRTVVRPQFNLTACVCPLFSPQYKKNIIEWVETNKILGVELFTVYVDKINDEERSILAHYKSTGIVEIRNWTLSAGTSPPWEDIHYRGQLTALNDCLYRNKGISKFTMVIDLDELILPSEPTDLALLKLIQRLPRGDNGVYIFRNSFHGQMKHANSKSDDAALNKTVNGSDTNDTAHKYTVELNMLNNFARGVAIQVPRSRSKVIFRPETVRTLGVHFAWRMIPPYQQYAVDPSDGLLHHYRSGGVRRYIEDKTSEPYMDKVIVNMKRTLNIMRNL